MEAAGIETAGDAVMWLCGALALAIFAALVVAYMVNRWRYGAEEAEHESLMREIERAQYRRDRAELIRAHLAE